MSWRWTFYINLPVGILSVLLALRHVHDTPAESGAWTGWASPRWPWV